MTQRSESGEMAWSESESRRFIEVGHIHTPNRDEIRQTILDLIPAMPDERFLAVELRVGGGWLSRAILERFPGAHLEYSGSLEIFQEFVDGRYNYYDYPDPMDMPSTIQDHLGWLAEAGFTGVDVFWQRAGHAVYGGYRDAGDRELRRTV